MYFPGHVDPGESEHETALRETEEEAGLSKNQFTILENFQKVLNYEVRGKPKKVVYWLSELKDPDTIIRLSNEHQRFEWLNLPEAKAYANYEDLQQTLQEAEDFIQKS